MIIQPIAHIKCNFTEKFGIPRQSGRIKSATGEVIFCPKYNNLSYIKGLKDFSHVWLIFDFSLCHKEEFSPTVRPPRLGGNERVGVFASRSPFRPNSLGLSCVKLDRIENDNGQIKLHVSGIDLLDGTPVYDIKPYIPFSDCVVDAKGSYAEENKNHKLQLIFPENLKDLLPKEHVLPISECICDDPRPSYHCDNRTYTMRYGDFDVSFSVENKTATVLSVKRV